MGDRLNAGDICTRRVTFADRTLPVDDAARLMREHHVGALVVVDGADQGRRVVGMLTDRDIVTGIVAKDLDPGLVRVGDAMGTELLSAREDDSILDLLGSMRRKGVRRLPVVDAEGVLVGLVTLDDVLEVVAEELRLVVQTIDSGLGREPIMRP